MSDAVAADILYRSRRRCCLCFFLDGDEGVQEGQLAHIDRNSSNSSEDNLVYLCARHHNLYDTRYSQAKSFSSSEVRRYKKELYTRLGTQKDQWEIVLKGRLTDFSEERLNDLVANLKNLAGGLEISIREVREGSVIVRFDAAEGAFEIIRRLHAEGTLGTALGVEVVDMRRVLVSPVESLISDGEELLQLGRFREAAEQFSLATESDPKNADAWFLKGGALLELSYLLESGTTKNDLLREAFHCSSRALELAPKDGAFLAQKSALMFELGEVEAALECIDEVIEMDKTNGLAWCNKGVMLSRIGRHADAVAALERSVELGYPQAADALSRALVGMRKHL